MHSDVECLGTFRPSILQSEVIEAEIRPLLPSCCQRERIGVRTPMGIVPHPDNLEWHHDGGGVDGEVRHMIVWASEKPTELLLPNGVHYTPAPFALTLFNNDVVKHRQPQNTNEHTRWFAGIRCSIRLHT